MSSMKVMNPRVDWFVGEMRKKLRANTSKKDSRSLSVWYLFVELLGETDELQEALEETENDKMDELCLEAIIEECADVANFAMMIADKVERQFGRRTK